MKRIFLSVICLFAIGASAIAAAEAKKPEVKKPEAKKKSETIKKDITNSLGMKFVYIQPGEFIMGSPAEEPGRDDNENLHKVKLTKGFYMQTREVTVGQWRAFVKATGFKTQAEKSKGANIWTGRNWEQREGFYWDKPGFPQTDDHPVTCISWKDVHAFIKWLDKKDNKTHRLPTEAQWEYACRAGSTTARYWGDDPVSACAYGNVADKKALEKFSTWTTHDCDDGFLYTAPVGRYKPNAFGLYDMLGNVWEWCRDRCQWKDKVVTGTYKKAVTNPLGKKGPNRIVRGGAWYASPRDVRSAYRFVGGPDFRESGLGFRLVRSP